MKAVVVRHAGGPEVLEYTTVPTPTTKPGWSLVNIKGFGINHSEIFTRRGDSPSVKFPRILGIECVGEIEKTTDPGRLPVGQHVISIMGEMGRAFDGSYAEKVLLPNNQIYPVTTLLSWAQLATMSETYFTAFGSMLNLHLTPHDRVLVRAATSGVGVAFAKLVHAAYPALHLVGSTRNLKKAPRLLQVGYSDVIEDQAGHLQTDDHYDKCLELVGPKTIKDTFAHMQSGGIVCLTGLLGDQWTIPHFDPIEDLPTNSYLTSFNSATVNEFKINQMIKFIEQYHVNLKPARIFKLNEIQKAHEYLESNHSFGKVIVLE